MLVLVLACLIQSCRSHGVREDPARTFVETIVNYTRSSCIQLESARSTLFRAMGDDMLPDRYLRDVVGDRRWMYEGTLHEGASNVAAVVNNFIMEAGCSPSFKGTALGSVRRLSQRMLESAIATHEALRDRT